MSSPPAVATCGNGRPAAHCAAARSNVTLWRRGPEIGTIPPQPPSRSTCTADNASACVRRLAARPTSITSIAHIRPWDTHRMKCSSCTFRRRAPLAARLRKATQGNARAERRMTWQRGLLHRNSCVCSPLDASPPFSYPPPAAPFSPNREGRAPYLIGRAGASPGGGSCKPSCLHCLACTGRGGGLWNSSFSISLQPLPCCPVT